MYRITLTLALALSLVTTGLASLVLHDDTFQPDYILRITAQDHTAGCTTRHSVLVNGTSPGPELRLYEGEVTWIRVYNDMAHENTTIHWHGLSAFTSPFSDGAPAASQWPIPAGYFFDYEVRPEPGTTGTYFYHSHVGFQAVTAGGALIVESRHPPPYQCDEERTIMLSDLFSKTDREIEDGLLSSKFTWSGETEGILVNGQGRPMSNATGDCQLASIAVEPGKTYRLRFIGATALSFVWLGIESHEVFDIIEADGHYTKPLESGFLQIASGQRYSILLKAKSEDELRRANRRQFYIQLTTLERPVVLTNFAVLDYSPETTDLITIPSTPPLPIANTTQGWLDYELEPLSPTPDFPTLDQVTRRIIIDVHQNVSDTNVIWLQSGYDWMETFPAAPYLVDIYEGKLNLHASYHRAIHRGTGFDNLTRTFPAKMGEVLEIVWQNQGTVNNGGVDAHPFHAHGRHFYDLGGGDGLYNPITNEERLQKQGTPIQRDTSVLYRYRKETEPLAPSGWRAWRIRVTSAGVWMMHCHILQHMVMGMQTVFTFGDRGDLLAQSGVVDQGYLVYGGSAYGNATCAPVVQHFHG